MATYEDCSIGYKAETTYGTAVTVDRWVEFVSEGFAWNPTRVVGEGMRVGRRFGLGSRRVTTTLGGEGSLELNPLTKGLGTLLKAAAGTGASALVSGSTYQQMFTPGDTLDSLTVQKGVPRTDGSTVDPYTFLGCMVSSWGLSVSSSDLPVFNFDFDVRDLDTAPAYATPSYVSSPSLYAPTQLAVTYGGTVTVPTSTALASGGTAVTDVREASFTINNNLNVDRYNIGGAGKKAKPTVGVREGSGSFTAEYAATTYRAAHIADTANPLTFTFTSAETLSTGFATLQVVFPEVRLDSSTPIANAGDLITVEHNFTILENASGQSFYVVLRTADTAL